MLFSEMPDNRYFQLETNSGIYGPIYVKSQGRVLEITNNGLVFVKIPHAFKVVPLLNGIVVKTREQDEYDSYMAAG